MEKMFSSTDHQRNANKTMKRFARYNGSYQKDKYVKMLAKM
jgi:hypothetical protein